MEKLFKEYTNLNSVCHTRPDRVSRGMIFNNKEYYATGSSGRANACPRMTEESGRSMVEMLGVLAVIGILSVAGIAGYKNAMNKHRANELLNEASKRAVAVAGQRLIGNGPSISEFTQPAYNFAVANVGNGDKQFTLTIENVPEEICSQMKNMVGTDGSIRTFSPANCSGTQNIVLTYNNDLSKNDPQAPSKKDEFGFCLKGYVPPDCTEKVTCSAAQTWTEAGCICENGKFGTNCDSDCDGFMGTVYTACQSCYNGNSIQTTQSECDKCPNREYVGGNCNLPSCPYGEFKAVPLIFGASSTCVSCTDRAISLTSTEEECAKCPNREYANGTCNLKSCPEGYISNGSVCVYENKENDRCKWTEWFDVDYPKYESGGGDFETYARIRERGGAVCRQPIAIECECENYPGLTEGQVGQPVHCDLSTGLICKNEEQLGLFKMCINYRVRVLCCEE